MKVAQPGIVLSIWKAIRGWLSTEVVRNHEKKDIEKEVTFLASSTLPKFRASLP
jgi:hypothetical protein